MNKPVYRAISLGAGVQSSALYLMAVEGEFGDETPNCAIFADTQNESKHVYEWLDELERIGGSRIPIYRTTVGDIAADILDGANRGSRIANTPFFVMGADGRAAMLRRTCTKEYKLAPKRRELRRRFNAHTGQTKTWPGAVEQWIGISIDEAQRMRDEDVRYIVNRYPLIERNMTRRDCEERIIASGYPKPRKSSCKICPYHDDAFWLDMKESSPEEFEEACQFDEGIRTGLRGVDGTRGMRKGGEAYLHRSLTPLRLVQLQPKAKKDKWHQLDMFGNDCTGMCGV